ncbi:hypothetical protein KAR91_21790 [Candidatus Pacearchaeota archaeon]|nr:hypothetical protein [Candidatus Pacearchaeota archaeon]
MKLHEEGKTASEIAKEIDRPVKSIRSKMSQKGITPHSEKEVQKAAVGQRAKTQVLSRISGEIAEEASGIYEQITTAGQWIYDNYNTIAKAKSLSLVEYVQQAMVFYANYYQFIEKMERKIQEQEATIAELTSYLDPLRYRVQLVETMASQEGEGTVYTPEKIKMYLDFMDYAVGKDIIKGKEEGVSG